MDRSSLPAALSSPTPHPMPAPAARRPRRGTRAVPAFRLRTLARLAAWMVCGAPLAVLAQATEAGDPAPAADAAPVLRTSPRLQETLPDAVRPQLPVFVSGDHVTGQPDIKATIEGDAELRRGDTVIKADRMDYTVADDLAKANGQVRINRAGNTYAGSQLELRVDAFNGFFTDANYRFLETSAHGEASRVDFIDRDRSVVYDATYTTCQRTDEASWQPDWILRARVIHLDREEDVGRAEGAVLEFKRVPILPFPGLSFPLSDRRKSGLLPPTVGLDSVSGFEYSQPYYWNIAPNRDATITPTVMSKRGVNLGTEFRYLEPSYSGEVALDYMPGDKLRDRDRWSYKLRHGQSLDTPVGGVSLGIDVQRVSDDNYWRDFNTRNLGTGTLGSSGLLSQRLLPGRLNLGWGRGDHSLSLNVVKWQTLQDVNSPITPPYDQLPQLHWRYAPTETLPGGFETSIDGDYTRFQADRFYTGQPNADRSYLLAQISRPFLAPAGFITPKVQLHTSQYQFDGMLANGQRSYDRTLPTFSLDSGLVFERDTRFFGRNFLQTLEPRAFYTYTPYRDQSMVPVYDTAVKDFNFSSVYTENAFAGNDRLADNNLLTLGVTTRLLDADTGAEAARFGIAQRLRFSDQNVTMPGGTPVSERLSDVLLGAGINWTPQWGFDSTVQYNPKTDRSLRSTVSARYTPGNYRTISAAYRMQKETSLIAEPSEQVDVGWQWPLNALWGGANERPTADKGRWFTVGRLNYSLKDRRLVDSVVGFEYEACCWIGRVVLERLQSSTTTSTSRVMFQLEFTGFSRLSLGSNPLASLQRNVPRYEMLGQNRNIPSRFSNYD
ncbi:LPS-assembly protein LptD [Paracidovorax wautersii]|nr:LPS-assembly protein LptD [Paracidovorax wautersii]